MHRLCDVNLVVVDRLIKIRRNIPKKMQITTYMILTLFFDKWTSVYGVSRNILVTEV